MPWTTFSAKKIAHRPACLTNLKNWNATKTDSGGTLLRRIEGRPDHAHLPARNVAQRPGGEHRRNDGGHGVQSSLQCVMAGMTDVTVGTWANGFLKDRAQVYAPHKHARNSTHATRRLVIGDPPRDSRARRSRPRRCHTARYAADRTGNQSWRAQRYQQ